MSAQCEKVNSTNPTTSPSFEFSPKLKLLRSNDQVRELQTILRDK